MMIRTIFDYSGNRLRRARRLYGKMCSRSINSAPELVHIYARRAKERGLYSDKTDIRSVKFSLCRHAYRYSEEFDMIGGFGWYSWTKKRGSPWWSEPRYNNGVLMVKSV